MIRPDLQKKIDQAIRLLRAYDNADDPVEIERRLGCIGCPLSSKNRINELKQYPIMVRALIRSCRKFMQDHPNSKIHYWFEDEYEYFARQLFNHNKGIGSVILNKEALFKADYKEILENYFNIKL